MRSKWKYATGVIALALVLGASSGSVPAVADDEVWLPGPVTIDVPMDLAAATAGIDPADIRDVSGTSARCYAPAEVWATWVGRSVLVNLTSADTDDLFCQAIVRIDYCVRFLGAPLCGYSRSATVVGRAGPMHIDSVPPVTTGAEPVDTVPKAAGWFSTPGKIRWLGHDAHSGIADCTSVPLSGPDAPARTVVGTCRDRAGNRSVIGWPFTYKYDATPPSLAPSAPSPLALGAQAHAAPGASDATSGIVAAECNAGAALDTSTAGEHTVTCTARDGAGNTATATLTYVVGYGFSGFAKPVMMDEVNAIKAGRGVPLTFHVTSDSSGTAVVDLDPANVTLRARGIACALGETPDLVEESSKGGSGLQNLGGGHYRIVWASPQSYAGSCKTLQLDLGDGLVHTAEFSFTR